MIKTKPEFKVWMTVDLDAGWSGDAFFCARANRQKLGFEWTFEAEEMLAAAQGDKRMELDLFALYPEELGIKERVNGWDVCARATELGLQICPLELPAFLLMTYRKKHPRFEGVFICGTRPKCTGHPRKPHLFVIDTYHSLLRHTCICEECFYVPDGPKWIFCKTHLYPPGGPRKQEQERQ